MLVALLVLSAAALACDDGEPQVASAPTLSVTPRSVVATTTPPATSGPVVASPTPAPAASPAVSPTGTATARPPLSPSPTAVRVDGTVAPQNFGSTDPVTVKSNPDPLRGTALLRDVRLGVHAEEGGWDRIVFEFAGDLPPGAISYVPSVVACGSGAPVTVQGGAVLAVRFDQTAAHTEAGQPTVARRVIEGPGGTILEARQTCDFEGEVSWAVGVKGRQRFKVTLLENPRRVVIDIQQ